MGGALGSGFTKYWAVFWEGHLQDNIDVGGFDSGFLVTCCRTSRFKLTNVGGTTRWKFWFDYQNDGTYVQLGPSGGQSTHFNSGNPQGETGRRPDITGGTGAFDHQNALLRATAPDDGGWHSWTSNAIDFNQLPPSEYYHDPVAGDEYYIRHT